MFPTFTRVPTAFDAYLRGEGLPNLPPPASPFTGRQPTQAPGISALRDGNTPLYSSPTANTGYTAEDAPVTEHVEHLEQVSEARRRPGLSPAVQYK